MKQRTEMAIQASENQKKAAKKALEVAKELEAKRLKEGWRYVKQENGALVLKKL